MRLDTSTVAQLTKESTKRDAKPDAIFFDDKLSGFGLRLRHSGGGLQRTFVVQYRSKNRTRRIRVGSADKISADEARKQAKTLLARIELGDDPQAEKAAARLKAGLTLRSVAEEYLAAKQPVLRPASFKVTKLYLTGSYFKPLHAVAVTEVTLADVAGRLTAITRTNGSIVAGRARAALSSMFKWAMGQGLLGPHPINPVIGTNRPADAIPRDRVLDDRELAEVWHACRDDDFGRIIRLLVLTGCRRNEIGGMTWSEVNLSERTLTLPAARVKNKRSHVVPLAEPALEIIKGTPRRLKLDLVFGGFRGGQGFSDWTQAKAALDLRLAGRVAPWRLHDLRRTSATGMGDIGVLPHVIEAALNHQSGHKAGIAGVYNRSRYQEEVRTALEVWASRVIEIIGRPRLRAAV
jgi:integrase